MHLGSLALIAKLNLPNLKHIIFNNKVHDSVGGQNICSDEVSFKKLALTLGYINSATVKSHESIKSEMIKLKTVQHSFLLEIIVKPGFRNNLLRPDISPYENKLDFLKFLKE